MQKIKLSHQFLSLRLKLHETKKHKHNQHLEKLPFQAFLLKLQDLTASLLVLKLQKELLLLQKTVLQNLILPRKRNKKPNYSLRLKNLLQVLLKSARRFLKPNKF
jgi:hypothetical protein